MTEPGITVALPGGIAVQVPALGLSVAEASQLTGVGEGELRRRINSGELRVIRVGRKLRIPASRLVEWLHGAAE